MHSGPNLSQIPPGFTREQRLVPASTRTDAEFRLSPEEAPDQIILNRGGTDASPARSRDVGTRSVREFPQFEHGAGI